MLGVHGVLRGIVALDGQECARADMQRHLVEREALGPHAGDKVVGKVKPRGGRGHRTLEFGIYRLITSQVDLLALAVEIGRNGYAAQIFEQLAEGHIGVPRKAHYMLPLAAFDDLGAQFARAAVTVEVDLDESRFPLFQIAHYAAPLALAAHGESPLVIGGEVRLQTEHLDTRPRRLVQDDARADNLGVVEHQQRLRRQLASQIAETPLGDRAVAVDEQFRVAALREREFSDTLVGQRIIEIVDINMTFHNRSKT